MDDIKRKEREKACKKIHRVRVRMVAVRMVGVLDMSVEETAVFRHTVPHGSVASYAITPKGSGMPHSA